MCILKHQLLAWFLRTMASRLTSMLACLHKPGAIVVCCVLIGTRCTRVAGAISRAVESVASSHEGGAAWGWRCLTQVRWCADGPRKIRSQSGWTQIQVSYTKQCLSNQPVDHALFPNLALNAIFDERACFRRKFLGAVNHRGAPRASGWQVARNDVNQVWTRTWWLAIDNCRSGLALRQVAVCRAVAYKKSLPKIVVLQCAFFSY